jgi:hypothetical protein
MFEAARRGLIPRVTRRLTRAERAKMIKHGRVFIFEEGKLTFFDEEAGKVEC